MKRIRAGNLLLRPILQNDAERFYVLCNDQLIAHNTARVPSPYSIQLARDFTKKASMRSDDGEYVFAVCRYDEVIGCAAIMPDDNPTNSAYWEIGYWVGADYRRKGVATRAVYAISTFAFEQLKAELVTADFFVDNPASGRVLKRCGFKPTGECRSLFSVGRGEEVATIRMALTKDAHRLCDLASIVME